MSLEISARSGMRSPGPSCPSAPAWSWPERAASAVGLRRPSPGALAGRRRELIAPTQGTSARGSRGTSDAWRVAAVDGRGSAALHRRLTEARRDGKQFALDGVSAALGGLRKPAPTEAVAVLRARVAEFAYGTLTDDLCLLAARISR
jgi:hypothetical protein